MAGPGGLGDLDSRDWKNLQEVADNLEAAWRKGEAVDLARFLPPPGVAARPAVLQELIKTDLECRWRRGQAVVLDYYLEKFPDELGTAQTVTPSLVYEEFRVRQLFGDRPELDLYQTRFPKQFDEVQQLVQQHSVKTNVPQQTPPPGKKDAEDYVKTNIGSPSPSSSAVIPSGPSGASSTSFGKNMVLPQIGGVALVERIGTGSFAEVWKAKAPGGIFKAIKIIIRPIDQEEAQREVESMELIKNLRHHFLLPIHQFWALDDRLIIMMDLADGSLRDCLNQHRKKGLKCVPLPDLLRYFRQACEALDYLHSKKVLHRDIKPENILLVEDNVRVADFGLAKVQATTRMATGTFAGTPLYMPPETWNDKTHPNGDQYSLAATYFELRTGRRLYKDGGLPSLMQAHLMQTPDLDPLEEAEQKVLLRALSKDPEARYPSCMAWFHDLEKAVAPAPPIAPPGPGDTLSDEPLNTLQPGQTRPQSWNRPDSQSVLGSLAGQGSVVREPSWTGRIVTSVTLLGLVAAVAWIVWGNRPEPGDFTLKPPTPKAICAGESENVRIVIKRENFSEPVLLKFAGDPDLTIEAEPIAADATSVPAKVTVADTAPAGVRKVKFEATAGGKTLQGEIELIVKPLATLPRAAPAGPFRPAAGTEIVTVSGTNGARKYYRQIECAVGGTAVRFVFIEKGRRPFYIMVDKVWNGLFQKFADSHPEHLAGSRWRLGAYVPGGWEYLWTPGLHDSTASLWVILGLNAYQPNPLAIEWSPQLPVWFGNSATQAALIFWDSGNLGLQHDSMPVLRVDIVEAQRFAEWLSGLLPSVGQWDTAAGRFEDASKAAEGPFLPDWQPGEVAINRAKYGPMLVGAAAKDRSLLGCNDMAGNGFEWTRTCVDPVGEFLGRDVSGLSPKTRVQLRGKDYAKYEPLRFDELDQYTTMHFFEDTRRLYGTAGTLAKIGFRVVIEVD